MSGSSELTFFKAAPEGNRLEVYALVAQRAEARMNRPLDLDKSVDEIVAQASGLAS